jgi:hypothetical protein
MRKSRLHLVEDQDLFLMAEDFGSPAFSQLHQLGGIARRIERQGLVLIRQSKNGRQNPDDVMDRLGSGLSGLEATGQLPDLLPRDLIHPQVPEGRDQVLLENALVPQERRILESLGPAVLQPDRGIVPEQGRFIFQALPLFVLLLRKQPALRGPALSTVPPFPRLRDGREPFFPFFLPLMLQPDGKPLTPVAVLVDGNIW